MPSSGCRRSIALQDRRAPRRRIAARGVEVADARDDDAARAASSPGVVGVQTLGAERRERLAHRRQVAGAVVDERDHSRPFVLGSIFASALVLRAGHAQRAARTP